jgi:hypothetical protein
VRPRSTIAGWSGRRRALWNIPSQTFSQPCGLGIATSSRIVSFGLNHRSRLVQR